MKNQKTNGKGSTAVKKEAKDNGKQTSKDVKDNSKEKTPRMTISRAFQEVLKLGCKNKEAAIHNIQEMLSKAGTTETRRGSPVTSDLIGRQFNAMMADLKKQRQGWWSKYKVIEQKDILKIALRV